MKQIFLVVTCLFLISCGAKNPLQRGKITDGASNEGQGSNDTQGETGEEPVDSKKSFETFILPALDRDCAKCHDNKAPTYEVALTIVTAGSPDQSILYNAASGLADFSWHRKVWKIGSTENVALKSWIENL